MIFLKLGGSLITDKGRPETPRPEVLRRVAGEIAAARSAHPGLQILLGHGSGSYGHQVASRYGTHLGAATTEDWRGFAEVWRVANVLNRLVVDAMIAAGLPAVSFPPSSSALTEEGKIVALADEPVARALAAGLLPIVAGDVAFDRRRGSAIVSTERIFARLALALRPASLLLAGVDPGVYADYPANTRVFDRLSAVELRPGNVVGSASTDVTGGMADKVRHAMEVARAVPGLQVRIFSGLEPGAIGAALAGEAVGTLILPDG